MTITPADLQAFDTIKNAVPAHPVRNRTSFDLSGTAKREVVFSQWYSYFLNPEEDHGLSSLFLDTLLVLSNSDFALKSFKVATEVSTKKGRIDILLTGTGHDTGKYIIIENKIYHTLENPLLDYWDFCQTDEKRKLGILLTLKPEKSINCFINVLHKKWIKAIFDAAEPLSLNVLQRHYFNDFYNAINNLTRYQTMSNHAEYFFENATAINNAIACRREAQNYITTQIENAGRQLGMKIEAEGSDRQRDFLVDGWAADAFYTIVFENLLSGQSELRIVFGLGKNHRHPERINQLDEKFKLKAESEEFSVNEFKGSTWHNYLTKIYKLSKTEFADLESFVVRCISNDFHPISQEIALHLLGLTKQL